MPSAPEAEDRYPDVPIDAVGALGLSVLVVGILLATGWAAALAEGWARGIQATEVMEGSATERLRMGIAQAASLLVALALGLRIYRHHVPLARALHLEPVAPRRIGAALVAGFALQFPIAELGNLLHVLWPIDPAHQAAVARLLEVRSVADAIEVLTLLCVLAPVGEELLFRGLLLPGLRARYGPALAVLGSALLFGMVHPEPVASVLAGLVGLLLGYLALTSGSTLPPIALHFGFNLAPVVLQRSLLRIEGFNTVEEGVYHLHPALVAAALTVAALALVSFHRLGAESTR